MKINKKTAFNIVKWLILIAVFYYLYITLSKIEVWEELKEHFLSANHKNYYSLLIVVLLMPFNIGAEAYKWKKLINKIEETSFIMALKAILSGMVTGFVSPNRVGDFAGRVLYLPKESRGEGVMLSLLNSFTQNIVLISFGLISASFFYIKYKHEAIGFNYFLKIFIVIISIAILLVLLFFFTKKNFNNKHIEKWRQFVQVLFSFNAKELSKILLFTVFRYTIFSIQFYYMLLFFGINLSITDALIAIPTTYLIVTFAPSYALAEPAVRGTVSLLVLSIFTNNEIGAILTSVATWLINYIIPLSFGAILLMRNKEKANVQMQLKED